MRKIVLISIALSGFVSTCFFTSPANAQCTIPNTITNGQNADASKVMGNFTALSNCANTLQPAGTAGSIQYNGGSGSFSGIGPLTDGQIAIGSTGNPPQTATLSAGPGISISNGPGTVTVATSAASVNPFYDSAVIPITKPVAANFTTNNSTGNTGTTTDMASRGVTFTTPSGTGFNTAMEEAALSSTAFTVTALVYPVGYTTGNFFWGIGVKDSTGRYAAFGFRGPSLVAYYAFTSINNAPAATNGASTGNAQNPVWLRLQLSGGNFNFSFSFDGENFNPGYTGSSTAFLGSTLSTVGLLGRNNASGNKLVLDVLSWTNTTP